MSGHGAPADGQWDIDPALRTAIVAARWHTEVQEALVDNAVARCQEAGIEPEVVWVPGTVEIPVVVRRLAERGYDAVIALGTVVRGGTPHFDYVCDSVTRALTDIPLSTGVPVAFGILTCDDDAQAYDRSGLPGSSENKGREAAEAALATATILGRL